MRLNCGNKKSFAKRKTKSSYQLRNQLIDYLTHRYNHELYLEMYKKYHNTTKYEIIDSNVGLSQIVGICENIQY